ncbi:MAG: methionyl-tRNA formyltransferase [Anaerolineaceae bacterium]|jgi:methionyl-tRNA formyltransferase
MSVRIVFMGSPSFALPSLEALHQMYQVVGVVTQPDKPAGRGRKPTSCLVKNLADRLGLPVYQPVSLRTSEALEQLRAWEPDLIVVAAYGLILPKTILDLPPKGCLNVHASLLPRWRGAAPIQASIAAGDSTTGVTIMLMDEGLDTGPVLSQREVPLRPSTTAEELTEQLAYLGAKTLIEILPAHLNGLLSPSPQSGPQVTYAHLLKKEDGLLDFNEPALQLTRKVRAYHPWPGTYFMAFGKRIKVLEAHVHDTFSSVSGEHYIVNGLPAVGTAEGLLVLDVLQPEGKTAMRGEDYLRGQPAWLE